MQVELILLISDNQSRNLTNKSLTNMGILMSSWEEGFLYQLVRQTDIIVLSILEYAQNSSRKRIELFEVSIHLT